MRLDQALVSRGLAPSRARAQALIRDGHVRVGGVVTRKPSLMVADQPVEVTAEDPWVGRGALKLLHALDRFALSPAGAVAADIGASTGGFTQVLLDRGAAHVHAVDVGHGQMAPLLAADPRVTNHEGVNVRSLPDGLLPPLDWIVADLSFISLEKALPLVLARARTGATLVCLVKPQFEAGPQAVGKGGIVRDPAAREAACRSVADFVAGAGWAIVGLTESPITGGDGNVEYLLAARRT